MSEKAYNHPVLEFLDVSFVRLMGMLVPSLHIESTDSMICTCRYFSSKRGTSNGL